MSVIDKVKDTRSFLEECVTELQKVTWPDWDQLRSATIVVGVFTALVSLVSGLWTRRLMWLCLGSWGSSAPND